MQWAPFWCVGVCFGPTDATGVVKLQSEEPNNSGGEHNAHA